MIVDTPAIIAVLGAGPVGLETALYARFLGYDVKLLERGRVADNVRRWGHVRMFSPFGMNASPLGLQALAAQDESYRPPDEDAHLTGDEWIERYLAPLSQSDLLADSLCENTRVVGVTRRDFRKGDLVGDARRAESPFRILVEQDGTERDESADVVIDTTGTFGNHNWLGRGGLPAVGETAAACAIEYGLPDVLKAARDRYAGRRTLVVGSGYSAATNIVALAQLAKEDARSEITWITLPREMADAGPIARFANDRLPARDELAATANAIAARNEPVAHRPGARLEKIDFKAEAEARQFQVTITDASTSRESPTQEAETHEETFDNVIANVGYRPDASIYEELQVHQCYATAGPMKLAAALLGETSADCLDQQSHGSQTLLNPEPNFYILGSKSYGRNSNFLVSLGLAQIRELFSIIGGREDLDLYATMATTG